MRSLETGINLGLEDYQSQIFFVKTLKIKWLQEHPTLKQTLDQQNLEATII